MSKKKEPAVVTEQEQAVNQRYRVAYPRGLNLHSGAGKEHPVLRVLPCGGEVEA